MVLFNSLGLYHLSRGVVMPSLTTRPYTGVVMAFQPAHVPFNCRRFAYVVIRLLSVLAWA